MSLPNCTGLIDQELEICNFLGSVVVQDPFVCDGAANYILTTENEDGTETITCESYSSPIEKVAGMLGDQGAIDSGNTAWLLASSALVMLMTPGLAFFYGGLAGESNASNTIQMSMISMALVTVQWFLFGYSFAFGPGGQGFGSFAWGALTDIGKAPSGVYGFSIPHYLWVAFQCMFAQITPALISGAMIGRMKFSSYVVFILLWTTLIYDPIAHWIWALTLDDSYELKANGWLATLGAIDFAGGTVIHIASGFSALAAAIVLGKRQNAGEKLRPHNVPLVVMGAALLWFGWFGFNAGSAGAADGIAAVAFINTHLAACTGFLTWMILELIFDKAATAVGAAAGAVAGLVAITPGCGFVEPWAALIFGIVGAIICYGAVKAKERLGYDDTLDAFGIHGVGGFAGAILTGIFATDKINFGSGAVDGNPILIGYQMAASVVAASMGFFGTIILLLGIRKVMGIRVSEEVEKLGLDESYHGGAAYAETPVTVQELQTT